MTSHAKSALLVQLLVHQMHPIVNEANVTHGMQFYVMVHNGKKNTQWDFYAEHEYAGPEAYSASPLPGYEFGQTFYQARDSFAAHALREWDAALANKTIARWNTLDEATIKTKGVGGTCLESLGKQTYRIVAAVPIVDRLLLAMDRFHGREFKITPEQRARADEAIWMLSQGDCDGKFLDWGQPLDEQSSVYRTFAASVNPNGTVRKGTTAAVGQIKSLAEQQYGEIDGCRELISVLTEVFDDAT